MDCFDYHGSPIYHYVSGKLLILEYYRLRFGWYTQYDGKYDVNLK